jgi:hypothetical protein
MTFKQTKTYLVRPCMFTETERVPEHFVVEQVSAETAIWAIREGFADSHFLDKREADARAAHLNATKGAK